MIARISTYFDCTEEKFWKKIVEPKSLQFVASPILSFQPLVKGEFDEKWVIGKTYELNLYFLNVLPLGRHRTKIVTIDKESNTIASTESSTLVPVWNHTIRFNQCEQNKLIYTDEIEIKAGWLTIFVWIFAQLFYRHRQKRWKLMLK